MPSDYYRCLQYPATKSIAYCNTHVKGDSYAGAANRTPDDANMSRRLCH